MICLKKRHRCLKVCPLFVSAGLLTGGARGHTGSVPLKTPLIGEHRQQSGLPPTKWYSREKTNKMWIDLRRRLRSSEQKIAALTAP